MAQSRHYQSDPKNPMTTAGDIIVATASGVPIRQAKGSNNTYFGVDGSGVLGYQAKNPPIVRLNYSQASNVYVNALANIGTFDLITAQSFTVGVATSVIAISTFGSVYTTNGGAGADVNITLNIDSGAAIYYLATAYEQVAGNATNCSWGGTVYVTLSAATHTAAVQIHVGTNTTTIYFDPASTALRQGRIQIAEFPS